MTQSSQYTILPQYYDRLVRADYRKIVRFIDAKLEQRLPVGEGESPSPLVLDLACGTGNITRRMAVLGYDMIGADSSPDMLNAAMNKRRVSGGRSILWLNQDMTSFELYGTVDAVVCCLDSLNYLLSNADLSRCFSLVKNYLNPDGVFIFDLNTRYKFEQRLKNRTYTYEEEDFFCSWDTSYSASTALCNHRLTFFIREGDSELFRSYCETQTQKYHDLDNITALLRECGFTIDGLYSDYTDKKITATDERVCFVTHK